MMHPAAHLTHMGSMVTNAGTYVGVPEHRFMYQSGMGFLHAPGGQQEGEHNNVQNMQYEGGETHHAAEAEHAMPQEMEGGGGEGAAPPEANFQGDNEHASLNGGPQQIVDQAMNENDQGMQAPGGADAEMVDNNNNQQPQVEQQNGGFQNEAAFGRNDVPGGDNNMYRETDEPSYEQEYNSREREQFTESKRKSIPKTKAKEHKLKNEMKRKIIPKRENSTDSEEAKRSKRQVDGMYSPYPARQMYPYAQETNNEAGNYFDRPKHHRRTTVNVDVIGKRDINDDNTIEDTRTSFLR